MKKVFLMGAFLLVIAGCGTKIVEETKSSPEPEMKGA